MSEELLVTLGVKDKGVKTQINAINKEIKYLDSYYKTASKSSDTFENSLEGLNTKLSTLEKKYEANKTKLQAYQKQVATAKAGIESKRKELENLNNSTEDNSKAIEKTEKQLATYQKQLKEAENNISLTELEMENLTEEINNTNLAIKNFNVKDLSQSLDETGQKLTSVGNTISSIGQKVNAAGTSLIALSAPMVAFAAYASKVGIDYESAMLQVQSTSSASSAELEKLSSKALELGEDIKGASATDVANSFNYLALAGYKTNEMLEAIEPNVKASLAFNADMATVTDLTTDSMSALGLAASDTSAYLDVVAQTSRNANTSGTQMLEAYIACGGMFKSFNTTLDESGALLGVLANRGIKGSEAGNSLNSILINLMGTTSTTAGALAELGVSAYDADGNFRGVETTLRDVGEALSGCTQEQEDMLSAALGGKTQIDTLKALISGLGEEYGTLKSSIQNADGAVEEMYETMTSGTAGNIEAFKSKLESLGISLANNLLPHINDLLEKGMELLDWFGSLDEETQANILKFGLFTAATGGALKVVGSLTTVVGNTVSGIGSLTSGLGKVTEKITIAKSGATGFKGALALLGSPLGLVTAGVVALGAGIYTYNEYQDAMNSKITTAKEELSFLERALLNITGTTTYSRKELEEMNLVYENFNSNISDSFQKSVEDMTLDIHDFGMELSEINLDGVLTEDEMSSLTQRVDGALESALSAIQSKNTELQTGLKAAFSVDGVLDENEASLIDWWNNRGAVEAEEAQKLRDEINEIENAAFKAGRELTEDEIASIQERYAKIRQIELEAQAANTYELEYAQNEFNNRIQSLDSEAAADLLKQRYDQYAEEEIAIKTKYDTLIAQAQSGYDSLSEEEQKQVDDTITRLEEAKANQLELNYSYWEDSYNYAVESNENLKDVINKYNGEILSNQDIKCQESLEKYTTYYKDLNKVNESGYYQMYNSTTDTLDDIYVSIDEHTGEVLGIMNTATMTTAGYTKEIADDIYDMVRTANSDLYTMQTSINDASSVWVDKSGNIVKANGDTIGSLKDVKENSDGTKDALLEMAGKTYEVKVGSDNAISSLREIGDKLTNLTSAAWTIGVDVKKNAIGGSVLGYATGTNSSEEGISYVNEKGWELIDSPAETTYLGSNSIGDVAYLSRGTKVTNHLSSTQMMLEAVRGEVSRQLRGVDLSNEYYNKNSAISRNIASSNNSTVSAQINNNEMISVLNSMVGLLQDIKNKDSNVYMDSKKVGSMVANTVDKKLGIKSKGRW